MLGPGQIRRASRRLHGGAGKGFALIDLNFLNTSLGVNSDMMPWICTH